MISVNRLPNSKSDFAVNEWMLDSGVFTELARFGRYRDGVEVYAEQIKRWKTCGQLLTAVSQDYMTEPFILEKTGVTVEEHQRLTIKRYDALLACDTGVYGLCQDWERPISTSEACVALRSPVVRRPSTHSSRLSSGRNTPVVAWIMGGVLAAWRSASESIAVAHQRRDKSLRPSHYFRSHASGNNAV
jgi:hypothetical protein